jgi:hypothetical protein
MTTPIFPIGDVYVYRLCAIDDWAGWQRLDHFVQRCQIPRDPKEDYFADAVDPDLAIKTLVFVMEAAGAAARFGWEGDIRGHTVYVSALLPSPLSSGGNLVVGWKQDNNGCTFIASRWPIRQYELEDRHLRIYPAPPDVPALKVSR